MKSRTITFLDVLDESIEVDGVLLDAQVETIIRDCGSNDLEIEFFDIKDVYISTAQGLIKLDQDQFKTRHRTLFKRFENACELEALKKAKKAAAEKWSYQDDEVSA